jgi:hypothetical protein
VLSLSFAGWGFQLGEELLQLGATALAQLGQLDPEAAVRAYAAHDAAGAEGEAVDLEAEIERVAGHAIGGVLVLDEAAFEAQIEDAAATPLPVLNAEVDGAVDAVASRAAAIGGWDRGT